MFFIQGISQGEGETCAPPRQGCGLFSWRRRLRGLLPSSDWCLSDLCVAGRLPSTAAQLTGTAESESSRCSLAHLVPTSVPSSRLHLRLCAPVHMHLCPVHFSVYAGVCVLHVSACLTHGDTPMVASDVCAGVSVILSLCLCGSSSVAQPPLAPTPSSYLRKRGVHTPFLST